MTDSYATPSFTGTVGDYIDAGTGARERARSEPSAEEPDRQIAFVDSSALVALADAGDASHNAAVAAYRDLISSGYLLFTTDFMIAETHDLLRAGPGPAVAQQWLGACKIALCPVEERDIARAKQRILGDSETPAISLADAISLAVMDRLGVTDVFAVDQSVLNASP